MIVKKYERYFVVDITEGIVYKNAATAAKLLGLSRGNISQQLNGKRKSVNGHDFAQISMEEEHYRIQLKDHDFCKL